MARLDQMRLDGASPGDVADAFSDDLLLNVGYFGTPDGAAAAFKRLSKGLDVAIVRVVSARPGVQSVLDVMRACQPGLIETSAG